MASAVRPGLAPGAGDPLSRVLALDDRSVAVRAAVGALAALALHLAGFGLAGLQTFELRNFVLATKERVNQQLTQTVDLAEASPPPPPPAPEPEPPAPAAPEAPAPVAPPPPSAPREKLATPPPPPPAAAEAGKVLTAEPDPNAPLDLTGAGFVTGTGERYAGGTTASDGTSKVAVRDPRATGGGSPGGTGTATPSPPPAPAKDLTRAARPRSSSWNCGFPAEADMAQVDYAVVRLVVTVGPDGRAKSVTVLSDPGYGFGALARQCALRYAFEPGLDAAGNPTTKTTAPFPVTFRR